MKCQNMKIADILFFIANLMTIYSSSVGQEIASSGSTTLENEGISKGKFDKDCPQLLKIFHDSNVSNFTVDCKKLNLKDRVVHKEYVLQQTCFLVRKILYFACDNSYSVSPDLFKPNYEIEPKLNGSVCPFNFSHIKSLDLKSDDSELVVKELTDKVHCSKVCEDLYSHKTQCVVLSLLNNSLKSKLLKQNNAGSLEIDRTVPEHGKLAIQKDESNDMGKNEEMEQESEKSIAKNIVSKGKKELGLDKENLGETGKSVTKPMGEQKTEKVTSTPKEEQMPKSDTRVPENENVIPGDDGLKSVLDDQNEDLTNEDGDLIAESLPDKSDLGKIDKISVPPPKGKEIYPAEGFFQAEDSHFFFYFIMVSSIIVIGYLAFHNKNKILAYALEGTSGRRGRRRPNPARYRKLETNLEEAISSSAINSAASNVVY